MHQLMSLVYSSLRLICARQRYWSAIVKDLHLRIDPIIRNSLTSRVRNGANYYFCLVRASCA